jgi:hypothetical protein
MDEYILGIIVIKCFDEVVYRTFILNYSYLPIDLNTPIKIGTKIRHALFESTLTTRVLVVMVLTISMLFKLNAL